MGAVGTAAIAYWLDLHYDAVAVVKHNSVKGY